MLYTIKMLKRLVDRWNRRKPKETLVSIDLTTAEKIRESMEWRKCDERKLARMKDDDLVQMFDWEYKTYDQYSHAMEKVLHSISMGQEEKRGDTTASLGMPTYTRLTR